MLHEETPSNPRSLYAIGKSTSEQLTRRYGELHGFQTVSVRLGGPYGPMERITGHRANQSALKEWTGNIVRGEPIQVGDRTGQRSFTYVTDIAEGVCAVLDAPKLSYDVYNNSWAGSASMAEVIAVLQELRPDILVTDVSHLEVSGRAKQNGRESNERGRGICCSVRPRFRPPRLSHLAGEDRVHRIRASRRRCLACATWAIT